MALFRQFRGNRASLDAQPLHDGYAYFCVDDGTFHIDFADADGNLYRKQINAANAETLCGMTLEELKVELATQDAVVLAEAQAYTDAKIAEIDFSGLTGNVQPDWEQTDETKQDYIKNKPEELSDEELLNWLNEADIVQHITSASGEIYTTNNNEIYIL